MTADPTFFRGLYGLVGPFEGEPMDDERVLALADQLLEGGCRVLQLRHKKADSRHLTALARALLQRTRPKGARLLVNDRLDVALIAGADGVHLGQDDLPVEAAREVLSLSGRREPFLIGLSTHDENEVKEARRLGVDYAGFGPVFGTESKSDALSTRGLEALSRAVQAAGSLPIVAIGGVGLSRAPELVRAGASMGAVLSELARAPDPAAHARALHLALGG